MHKMQMRQRVVTPKFHIITFCANIMRSQQSLTLQNRHKMLQSFQEPTPNYQKYLFTSSLHTLFQKFDQQPHGQALSSSIRKSKYWNETQQLLFNQFWLEMFIQNPFQNFSFDAPLNRKSYNKALSQYIKKRAKDLNVECQKSPTQCKSKFGTIKRKIQRQRKTSSQSLQTGFIELIIKKSQSMAAQWPELQHKLEKVKELKKSQSPFVRVILEQYRFQQTVFYEKTLSSVKKYIESSSQSSTSQFSK